MDDEKNRLLKKINDTIAKKKDHLINKLPQIHNIDDGFVIRFFSTWEGCSHNDDIKYKKIINQSNNNEKSTYFFIPKGTYFSITKKEIIKNIICFEGKLELEYNNEIHLVDNYTNINLNLNKLDGRAIENTYALTSNM